MSNYKIVVAHPGQQHSFYDALGLKKNGMLLQYITAVYDSPHSLSMKLAHLLVRGNDAKKILNRKIDGLEEQDVTQYYTFLSLAVIVLSRNKYTRNFSNWLDRWISRRFGKKVAKYAIKHNADGVLCFISNENTCFTYLKKKAPHIKRLVDCSSPPHAYMKKIYEEDMRTFSHKEFYHEVPFYWGNAMKGLNNGVVNTQVFIAPSNFVKKGLIDCGVAEPAIAVAHYGTKFALGTPQTKIPNPPKFIFVGGVKYEKGIHHLFRVVSDMPYIDLTVVGAWSENSVLYEQYQRYPNIHFCGNVLHSRVQELLDVANVYVFPALAEGLSIACAEALSRGLPIICTENSGINDVVENGKNGFVYDCSDEEALRRHIQFFIDHPERIPDMSRAAIDTASNLTWEHFGNRLSEVIKEFMKK